VVKPRSQKEVKNHDTANPLPFQDSHDKGETDGTWWAGIDGRIQTWKRVERAYGPIFTSSRKARSPQPINISLTPYDFLCLFSANRDLGKASSLTGMGK
jgi:hypothetical protein